MKRNFVIQLCLIMSYAFPSDCDRLEFKGLKTVEIVVCPCKLRYMLSSIYFDQLHLWFLW